MTVPATRTTLTETPVAQSLIPLFELDTWRPLGLRAGITGRHGSFDLGLFADGRAGAVLEHWLAFEAAQGSAVRGMAVSRQVHGGRVSVHDQAGPGWFVSDGFDGHLTAQKGLLLTITVADCVPIYLAHPDSGTVALLHAGWRGAAAGILENGIQEMIGHSGCPTTEIVMHCGVSICGECYEVGPEVIRAVTGKAATSPGRLDLRSALCDRAEREGVRDMTVSTWCASHDMDLFFSHRRSRGSDGRMVAYLGVPAA